MHSAVHPEPFVFGSFTSAPSASSAATWATRPRHAAYVSGVSPSRICAEAAHTGEESRELHEARFSNLLRT